MVVGWTDGLAISTSLCASGDHVKIKWSTGWTDGFKIGIGAFNVTCSRDDIKRAGAKFSVPVEPARRRSIASVHWRRLKREAQRLVQLLCVTGWTDVLRPSRALQPPTRFSCFPASCRLRSFPGGHDWGGVIFVCPGDHRRFLRFESGVARWRGFLLVSWL